MLWVEPKTTVQSLSAGTTTTTWCHLCSVSIGIHNPTMSHSQILQHHHYASLLLWLSSCQIQGMDCVNTKNQAYAMVFHQGTSVFQLVQQHLSHQTVFVYVNWYLVSCLSPHGCSIGRLVMLFGPNTPSVELWLWCHWCKGLCHASKLSSFSLWPSQIDAMMPSFALVTVWSNPPPSPSGYLSKLHGFDRQTFLFSVVAKITSTAHVRIVPGLVSALLLMGWRTLATTLMASFIYPYRTWLLTLSSSCCVVSPFILSNRMICALQKRVERSLASPWLTKLSICLPIFFTTSTHFPHDSSATSLTSCFVTSLSWLIIGADCWAAVIHSRKLLATCLKICYDCAICASIFFWARSSSVLNLSSLSLCAF